MRLIAIAFVLLAFPLFRVWLGLGRQQRLWTYLLVGMLPFTINAWQLDAALINWAGWPGYAKGLVVTLLDSVALAIIATHRAPRGFTPFVPWLLAYLAAATFSIAFSDEPIASAFYGFQLVRVIIVVVAVARIAPDREGLRWLAYGLAVGIAYQAAITIMQKAVGAVQASGTMGHQNLLGMMTHFALLPLLALLLAGERNKIVMLGVFSALVVIALGASRGAIGFAGAGITLLFALSLARRATDHKWRMLGFGVAAFALTAPVMVLSLQNRFELNPTESGEGLERIAFARAANAIWSDHPFGIGANMYVIISNTKGYAERAGVNWNSSSRSTNVHNVYLLVAAETGWLGLIAFVALWIVSIATALHFAFSDRRDPVGDIVLGCAVALIVAVAHGRYEWVFVTYQAQYVAAISLGLIGGLVRERRNRSRRERNAGARLPTSAMPQYPGDADRKNVLG